MKKLSYHFSSFRPVTYAREVSAPGTTIAAPTAIEDLFAARTNGTAVMEIKRLMSNRVHTVTPEHTVNLAARLMLDYDIGVVPVVEGDQLVGIITDRDIVVRSVVQQLNPAAVLVREIMSQEVVVCRENEPADVVSSRMGLLKVRRMPVVDRHHRLVGLISLGDLAQREAEDTIAATLQAISNNDSPA